MNRNNLSNNYFKASNRSLTLQLLFQNGTLSRTDIAKHLNITTASVTAIVNEFLHDELLIQTDDTVPSNETGIGRRKSLLRINYDWKYIVVIDIHSYYINIAVTNLKGKILTEDHGLPITTDNPGILCEYIAQKCLAMLKNADIPFKKILGAGITIIGPVNHIDGIALHPFRLFDYAIPIRSIFETLLPFPVALESNVCSLLISELLYTNLDEKAQNILMLKWGPGVGSAMAIAGFIYKGFNYQSTEIGHNQIAEKNGKKCNCGLTGCLEPSVSVDAIIEFIQNDIAANPLGELAKLKESLGAPTRKTLSTYLTSVSSDSVLWLFLTTCAHSLASVTNNAIHLLAPDKLILVGDLFEHDSIVNLFTEQLYLLNPKLPPDLCLKHQTFTPRNYLGGTAIAIKQLLLHM